MTRIDPKPLGRPAAIRDLEIFAHPDWQMSPGERAALEGLLVQMRPQLAIEVGTAEGGSLHVIAAHSANVHAIDITDERLIALPSNVAFHKGDSRQRLPELLSSLASDGRNVDFVLVDGDHSAAGVRSDLKALLDSPATSHTVVLLHDSLNPDVRAGIESAVPANHRKVAGLDLDFVPGRLGKLGPFTDQLLGGFALVILEDSDKAQAPGVELGFWSLRPMPILFHDAYEMLRRGPGLVADPGGSQRTSPPLARIPLDAAHLGSEQLRRELETMQRSWSWRVTAPLRAIKRVVCRAQRQ